MTRSPLQAFCLTAIAVVCCLRLPVHVCSAASAEGVVLRGTVVSTYKGLRNPSIPRTNRFAITILPPKYAIEIEVNPAHDPAWLRSVDCTFDGSDCFLVKRNDTNYATSEYFVFEEGKLRSRQADAPMKLRSRCDTVITQGPLPPTPPTGHDAVLAVWLSLASHLYLSAPAGRLEMRPVFFLGAAYDLRRISLDTAWSRNRSAPGFIADLLQIHPGKSYQLDSPSGLLSDRTPVIEDSLAGDLRSGYTNLTYHVTEWGTKAGVRVPLSAEVVRFGLRKPSSEGLYVQAVHKVRVLDGAPDFDLSVFIPRKDSNMFVTDLRTEVTGSRVPFTYFAPEGRIRVGHELTSGADHRAFMRNMGAPPPSRWVRVGFQVLLLSVVMAPLILILVRRLRSNIQTKTQNPKEGD